MSNVNIQVPSDTETVKIMWECFFISVSEVDIKEGKSFPLGNKFIMSW